MVNFETEQILWIHIDPMTVYQEQKYRIWI